MSDFIDNFPDAILLNTLGDTVTYTELGVGSSTIKAVVDYGINNTFATDSYVPQSQVTVQALKTDMPNIKKGDSFIHNTRTLTVDSVIDDDGVFVLLAVR